MPVYNSPDDLLDQLRKLRARVEELERATPLRNAAISDGGQFVVKGVEGRVLVLMGRTDDVDYEAPDGHKQMVFRLYREDGSPAFIMGDPAPTVDGFNQFLAMYDRGSNELLSDDTTSGQGLARPYLPAVFTNYPAQPGPDVTTSSGSWTSVQRCSAYIKQHPRLYAGIVAITSTGTTGEVRLWDATHGKVIGSPVSVPAFTYQGYNIGPAELDGAHMDGVDIDLQIRRVSGAGSIGAYVTTAYGVQS